MPSIPVVNLSDYSKGTPQERERFIRTFGDGLREFGFVTVDQHAVPLDLTHRVFELSERLFALPEATKRGYILPNSGGARGYTAFGKERAVGAPAHDLKEFWHVGQDDVTGPLADLYPRNVWPEGPNLGQFRHYVLELFRALERCAASLLEATALYLRLEQSHFAQMAVQGNSVLRIIHYPPVEEGVPASAVRAAAHEDINLITLLCEATTGGLELKTRDGRWLPVSSLDGQIVADAGDMLQLATNGMIPATTHRVVNPETGRNRSRYSMPFFVHPRPEVLLQPASTTVSPERPAKYTPITAHDYLTERLRAIGLYDADPLAQVS
jgi:isopenicillin N synthase-like dioxygenase